MSLSTLLFVCLLLQLASICAGWAPLFVLAPGKRRLLSTVGVGVLLGTAFVVVIPSGVHIMYMPPRGTHNTYAPPVGATAELPQHAHATTTEEEGDSDNALSVDTWAGVSPPAGSTLPSTWKDDLNKFKAGKTSPPVKHAHEEHEGHAHEHTRRRLLADAHDAAHVGHSHALPGHTSASSPANPQGGAVVGDDALVEHAAAAFVQKGQQMYSEAANRLAPSPPSTPPLLVCFGETHASKLMGALLAMGFVVMLMVDRFVGRSPALDVAQVTSPDLEAPAAAPSLPASSSTRSNGEQGAELLSRGKSQSIGAGGGSGGGNGGASGSNVSGSPGTLNISAVGERSGSGGGHGSATSTPRLPIARSTPTGTSQHLSFPTHAHPHMSPSNSGGGAGGTLSAAASSAASAIARSSSVTARASSSSSISSSSSSRVSSGLMHDLNVLLGVFVAAVVEGVTLGTLAVGSSAPASWGVLPALLLHHAPSSFGVASFLMYQGKSALRIRKAVLLYASTAPICAILAYALQSGDDGLSDPVAGSGSSLLSLGYGELGLATLFAGGAFLFSIAVHILPEIQAQNGGGHSHGQGQGHGHGHPAGSPHGAAANHGHGHGGRGGDNENTRGNGNGPTGGGSGSVAAGSASPGGNNSRMASPASRHEEASLLASAAASLSASASSSSSAGGGDAHVMPWPHVWALILGLLMPLMASWTLPRNPLL